MSRIPTDAELKQYNRGTLAEHLGIEILSLSLNKITARMPVVKHNQQPFGLLHGGATAAFAETLASIGGAIQLDLSKAHCVGLSLNINHLKGVSEGWVSGEAIPLHIGQRTQVWEVKIFNEAMVLVSDSKVTLANIPKK